VPIFFHQVAIHASQQSPCEVTCLNNGVKTRRCRGNHTARLVFLTDLVTMVAWRITSTVECRPSDVRPRRNTLIRGSRVSDIITRRVSPDCNVRMQVVTLEWIATWWKIRHWFSYKGERIGQGRENAKQFMKRQ